MIPHDLTSANFREIRCGNIAPGKLYRSSHPIPDNKQERNISLLANKAHIATVVNLSDTGANLKRKVFYAPWYNALNKKGNVIALGMTYNIMGNDFFKKLGSGLRFMLSHEAPYLIHCHAGIDRTGFVCAVLEAFMGAQLPEIARDYARSFSDDSETVVRYGADIEQAAGIESSYGYILNLFSELNGNSQISGDDIQAIAANYLLKKVTLTELELGLLRDKLSNSIV